MKNEKMPTALEEIPDFEGRAVYFLPRPDGILRQYGYFLGSGEFLLEIADRVEAVRIRLIDYDLRENVEFRRDTPSSGKWIFCSHMNSTWSPHPQKALINERLQDSRE